MSTAAARRGVLLWIDDDFEGIPLPDDDPWGALFKGQSDRVFRLMDLNLDVTTSVQETMTALDYYDLQRSYGTFVFCVVDLRIPFRPHENPQMKHGLALATELRQRGYPFVLLSAKSNATRSLDRRSLSTVPYYVKESADSPWQTMPEALKHVVLNEFNSHIGWLGLGTLVGQLTTGSSCDLALHYHSDTRNLMSLSTEFFPFFGIYRDFTERCEYRVQLEPGQSLAVRSNQNHSDIFVQQALLVIMASMLIRMPEKISFDYGYASDDSYFQLLQDPGRQSSRSSIRVLRVDPDRTNPELLLQRLNTLAHLPGTLVLVVPNDESCDAYADVLRERGIPTVGELPQDRENGGNDREMVVRRSAELVVRAWAEAQSEATAVESWQDGLSQPELIINPIDWCILFEASDLVAELSDPYECILEMARSFEQLSEERRELMRTCLEEGRPLPYRDLLQVGRETFMNSSLAKGWPVWIERAIDSWLNSSWRFPHGLDQTQFTDSQVELASNDQLNDIGLQWQDSCYEMLVGMLDEYTESNRAGFDEASSKGRDLTRVEQFVRALGGLDLLGDNDGSSDWDALEFLRWPHLRYPMPQAVTVRLKQAGRFLWIQPDGLNLAAALPVGRQRYRLLVDAVDHYWKVLGWGSAVIEKLPAGWSTSIGHLLEVLRGRDVAVQWAQNPRQFWDALLGLLRNASPVLFIADQVVRGRPLQGSDSSALEYLPSVQGYGMILSRLRGSRAYRLGGYLMPAWDAGRCSGTGLPLAQLGAIIAEAQGKSHPKRTRDLFEAFLKIAVAVHNTDGASDDTFDPSALNSLVADRALGLTECKDWFIGDRQATLRGPVSSLPSLLSSKADHLWAALDTASCIDGLTQRFRYYDGYHFLAALNDLRVQGKDTRPQVSADVMEQIVELFVASLGGILTQLAFCVEMCGHPELAEPIRPPGVELRLPVGFEPPDPEQLANLIQVVPGKSAWEVFVLGIPGAANKGKLCYHDNGKVKRLGARKH